MYRYCGDVYCSKCTPHQRLLPKRFKLDEPQRVCITCAERLLPEQTQLIREVARHNLTTPIDYESDVRYWNVPYAKSLDMEIKKAAYSLYNLYHLDILKDGPLSFTLLRRARGFMFLTVAKGGFMFAPKVGTGLIVSRLANGRYMVDIIYVHFW
jgi:SH3 domain-containing YSC84-like protein 1